MFFNRGMFHRWMLGLIGMCLSHAAAAKDIATDAVQPGIAAAISQLEADGFRGLVLAAHKDKILIETVVGDSVMNTGTKQRLTKESIFRFASITKQFTAVLVMQQVDAGKIDLDQALGKYWPDFPNVATRAVTIRQLMMHMSGLPNPDKVPQFYTRRSKSSGDMQVSAQGICAAALQRAPGSGFDYNNCDYIVLGALLERMSGASFASLLQEKIFAPAQMTSSGMYTATYHDDPRHVRGMMNGAPEIAINFASYGAAGAAFGSMRDLLAFDQAFTQGKLMSLTSRSEMVKPNNYGAALGVWSYPFAAKPDQVPSMIIERQGWIGGVRTLNLIDLKNEVYLVMVSTNGDLDLSQTWANKGPAAGVLRAALLAAQ
ncbi:serine hydrolase domain-containing protein [Undibacterium sp. RuTC16W]|uniref:serine hydrolase domain-containing protein n=1 Tax=Undibacterium sp. RuTC16W TaxID=3413048 RepID=UPI003BF22CE0